MMRNVFSILLSFILSASLMHLTIGTHFCGGEAVETKILLGDADLGCIMSDMEEPLDSENSNENGFSFENLPCCENKYQTVQVTNEFVKDAVSSTLITEFAVTSIYPNLHIDLYSKSILHFYTEYISPSIEKDIQVFFQTFLI